HWMEHIDNMDILRKGIGLRGLGQKDPVLEYRREGTDMFDNMIDSIQNSVAINICKLPVDIIVERKNAFEADRALKKNHVAGVYSNSPCPCGSGKKYKHCCGKKD
ncbi:preprotein translocase subunit SecA, partial [bacterium]|nr:preprotein translocase subunit SecA [bacterium]